MNDESSSPQRLLSSNLSLEVWLDGSSAPSCSAPTPFQDPPTPELPHREESSGNLSLGCLKAQVHTPTLMPKCNCQHFPSTHNQRRVKSYISFGLSGYVICLGNGSSSKEKSNPVTHTYQQEAVRSQTFTLPWWSLVPKRWQTISPTVTRSTSLYAVIWLSNLRCLLPSYFHLGPSRITHWTAKQLQKEKQEVNLVWEGCCCPAPEMGTDTHFHCKLANSSKTKHPFQTQAPSSSYTFPRKPRYEKNPSLYSTGKCCQEFISTFAPQSFNLL